MSVKFSNSIEEALGKTYSIAKAFVLDKTFLVFAAMKTHEDNWNMYAKLIIYFPQGDDEKWISLKFNEIFGQPLFGGLLHKPDLKVVLISEFGHVFYIEKENGMHPQSPIPNSQIALERTSHALYFHNAKIIDGHVYTVSNLREVFKYSGDQWNQLKEGIDDFGFKIGKSYGFRDIDGFAEDDIYAAGGKADLWHWNGQKWTQQELPTNASLRMICCGEDGLVYIPTNRNTILCGRDNNWEIIKDNIPETYFESIVWYKDRVYVSTSYMLCQIQDKKVTRVDDFPFYATGSLAVGDGIMVAALGNEVAVYDGETWTDISKGKKLPWEEK